jgi:hypothetical protein
MKRTITIVLALAALGAPAAALAQSPVQRINAQERARGNDPRVVGTTPQAAATPVERILAQERARGNDPRVAGTTPQAAATPVERIIAQERARRGDPALYGVPASSAIQIVEPGGFHWGDAGIGAAFAVALMLLALGTTLVVRHAQVRSA